jgi:hypothetical protein
MVRFEAVLQPDPTGTGTFVAVPREVNAELGLKGRPKINSVIAGHRYRGSLMPLGDGTFCLGVLKSIQESAGVKRGDTITVELELDTAPRSVDKKEMARSLEEAKRPETRERRLATALAALRKG